MTHDVRAEDLKVGGVVELHTQFGSRAIRLSSTQRRRHGVKCVGLDAHGTTYSFGLRYGEVAALLDG